MKLLKARSSELHYHPHPEELVIKQGGERVGTRHRSVSLVERRVAIAGPYVELSSLRALCPPMAGDLNGLLGSDFDTRKIIENYGGAIIMASQ
ncbi:hypothetical protein ACVK1X_006272 [Pseudomonas sp. PvR086]